MVSSMFSPEAEKYHYITPYNIPKSTGKLIKYLIQEAFHFSKVSLTEESAYYIQQPLKSRTVRVKSFPTTKAYSHHSRLNANQSTL